MAFEHRNLDAYRAALEVLRLCDEIKSSLPRGQSNTRAQIERASTSVIANLAEGAGELSPPEKARFYRMAKRSAIELAAWLEIVEQRKQASVLIIAEALGQLEDVVKMTVGLIRSASRR